MVQVVIELVVENLRYSTGLQLVRVIMRINNYLLIAHVVASRVYLSLFGLRLRWILTRASQV